MLYWCNEIQGVRLESNQAIFQKNCHTLSMRRSALIPLVGAVLPLHYSRPNRSSFPSARPFRQTGWTSFLGFVLYCQMGYKADEAFAQPLSPKTYQLCQFALDRIFPIGVGIDTQDYQSVPIKYNPMLPYLFVFVKGCMLIIHL